jgi:hypothetical protein
MSTISGTTRNGATYEGEYEQGNGGRIRWTATFRRNGEYAGMRHGHMHALQDVAPADVDDRVRQDIDSIWTDET